MKKKTIERMALTLREQEAELEAAANARPLSQLTKLDEENCDFEDVPEADEPLEPWQTCRERGYCTVLGEHSNPTVFDCDKYCPGRK